MCVYKLFIPITKVFKNYQLLEVSKDKSIIYVPYRFNKVPRSARAFVYITIIYDLINELFLVKTKNIHWNKLLSCAQDQNLGKLHLKRIKRMVDYAENNYVQCINI